MTMDRTLSIIKPDATKRNITGKINDRLEQAGLKIVAQKRIRMSRLQAAGFYSEHEDRDFFVNLVDFMTSGPIVVQVLEGKDAVKKNRAVMGATDPEKASEGTIRKDFALSLTENSVHGSDSPESAVKEISFFFSHIEIVV